MDNKIKLPEGYLASFRRAVSTFKHARSAPFLRLSPNPISHAETAPVCPVSRLRSRLVRR